ncbi:RNA polymerase sigma-70 factor (sigma-E family) [Saccharothrix coeruleofusca]|uniref:RNA polymerase sigma factor n=1 Tax=Saccharothrix coeruleofusca TaxID=33919 RepID=UPI0027DAE761|nr:SigE family RNA polymerase sigma factor [Saccharothrix coeruleofusca]MBP2340073.1 RNA polymerase sigma-70 factor (sigma-E family) [Saccharothrix coeruleofusca]
MDRHDFTHVVRERSVPWRRVAFLICGDWGRAEDLTQVALIRLYRHWHRIDGDGLEAYVRRVISRLAVDEAKRAARRGEVLGEVPDRAGSGVAVDEAVSGTLDVREALRKVPPRQRAVLVLRFYDELSVAETAAALGISQGTVKSQCARGLQALQTALGLPVDSHWAPTAHSWSAGHTERPHAERSRG